MSYAGDTFVYDSGIELPFEVMEELVDVLPTMSKLPNAFNYALLGEDKDSYGNEYRTALKASEFGGLKICRMKKGPTPIDFATNAPGDEDVDPIPAASTTTAKSPGPKNVGPNVGTNSTLIKMMIGKRLATSFEISVAPHTRC
jgi:hypothetical protein